MAHPFVSAVLAASVAAGLVVAGASPAAADEAEQVFDRCYGVFLYPPELNAEACIPDVTHLT